MRATTSILRISIIVLMSLPALFTQQYPLEDLHFNQISFGIDSPEKHFSNIGMISFGYVPPPAPLFLNIMAYSQYQPEPIWLIRNALLTDRLISHLSNDQLTIRFLLDTFNFPKFLPAGQLKYNYITSSDVLQSGYDINIYPVQTVNLTPFSIKVGWSNTFDFKWFDEIFNKDLWTIPFVFTDVFYIGCDMPNYDLTGAAAENGCGPAAAANSMTWMSGKYGFNIPGNIYQTYCCLSNLMNRSDGSGVSVTAFIKAKLDFIEMYDLPIIVEYQCSGGTNGNTINSSTGSSSAKCVNTGTEPDKNFLFGQGQAGADVEIWVGMPGTPPQSHIMVVTGGLFINGNGYLYIKQDLDQTRSNSERAAASEPTGTVQESCPVDVSFTGKMYLENFGFGNVTGRVPINVVVSERYDPNHKPKPKKIDFKKYCDNQSIIVPPNSTITFSYPTDDSRSFKNSVYTQQNVPGDQKASSTKNAGEWNNNSGRQRTYANNDSIPTVITLHNDEPNSANTGKDAPYTVDYSVKQNPKVNKKNDSPKETSTPFNPESSGGFSIGFNNSSSAEFGNITTADYTYLAGPGKYLIDMPGVFGQKVKELTITHPIAKFNVYWEHLLFLLNIDTILHEGNVEITLPQSSFCDTINVNKNGLYIIDVYGLINPDTTFKIRLTAVDNVSFEIDNLGIVTVAGEITCGRVANKQYCAGDSIMQKYEIYNKYPDGNTFTLQMSDLNGSFNKSTIITSQKNTNSGFLSGKLPDDTKTGSKYRFRVISSYESFIGTDNGEDVLVSEKPAKPVITQSKDSLISSSEINYQWYSDYVSIDGATGRTYVPDKSGKYMVQVSNEYGCESEFSEEFEYVKTNILETDLRNEINIRYDIASQKLRINSTDLATDIHIKIFNLLGEELFDCSSVSSDGNAECTKEIDLSAYNLPKGLYLVRWNYGNSIKVEKFIIY